MTRTHSPIRTPILLLATGLSLACSGSIDPGPRVQIVLTETALGSSESSVRIEQAWVTTWSITLDVCAQSSNKHGLIAPNRASTVIVENVADGASFGPADEMSPIPGEYCAITIESLPADEDAVGETPAEQQGLTLRMSGFREDVPFVAETAAAFTHRLELEARLDLRVGDQWTLRLTRNPSAWLQSDDFDWLDSESIGRAALQDALWTASVTLEETDAR